MLPGQRPSMMSLTAKLGRDGSTSFCELLSQLRGEWRGPELGGGAGRELRSRGSQPGAPPAGARGEVLPGTSSSPVSGPTVLTFNLWGGVRHRSRPQDPTPFPGAPLLRRCPALATSLRAQVNHPQDRGGGGPNLLSPSLPGRLPQKEQV